MARIVLLLIALTACGDNIIIVPATLDDLELSGVVRPLNPDFEDGVRRYSVIAADPAESVAVTAHADEHLDLWINGERAVAGEPHPVAVEPGDVITVVVDNRRDDPVEYQVIYLPNEFPELRAVVLDERRSRMPLYLGINVPEASYATILDENGVPLAIRATEHRLFDFKKHPNGYYSYAVATGELNRWDRPDYRIIVLDDQLAQVDEVATVGLTHTDLHDFHILDNGNYLMMAYDGRLADMSPYGGEVGQLVEDSVIQEITPDREIAWQWNSWGKLRWEDRVTDHESDYAHVNSFLVDDDGNLLVSARGTSQIVTIDRETGDILWKLGGKTGDFELVSDPIGNICGQHTASAIGDGNNILIFDNGQNCWPVVEERGELTRVSEYRLDHDAGTAELIWSYQREELYSRFMGSSQRLPNGNTLIGWGGGPAVLATEVDPNGEVVFELTGGEGDLIPVSYRAWRFAE